MVGVTICLCFDSQVFPQKYNICSENHVRQWVEEKPALLSDEKA
jgi:hypothetical protein